MPTSFSSFRMNNQQNDNYDTHKNFLILLKNSTALAKNSVVLAKNSAVLAKNSAVLAKNSTVLAKNSVVLAKNSSEKLIPVLLITVLFQVGMDFIVCFIDHSSFINCTMF